MEGQTSLLVNNPYIVRHNKRKPRVTGKNKKVSRTCRNSMKKQHAK